jgi:diguanylate cyclase (GGDEF)-like protein/PAS domain S-box-containing protein
MSLLEILLTTVPAIFYIVAYGLNRSGRGRLAVALTIGVVFSVVLASAILGRNIYRLEFLLIVLFLTSVFLSTRSSVIIFAVAMLDMLLVPLLFPDLYVSDYSDLMYLVGVVGLLSVIGAAISRQDIKQIEQQSHQLADEIARRQQMEVELRKARDTLEIKIAERTAEILQLNQQLRDELAWKESAEQTLKKSEERYRTLAEAAQEMIFIINRDDRIEYVNGFAAVQLGHTAEEIIGQPRLALFPPEIAEQQNRNIQKVYETGDPVWFEEEVSLPGMMWLNTGFFPLRDREGTVYSVLGFAHDISERKQLEGELRGREESFRNIYENSVEGIFQSSLDGCFLHANNAMARIFGYESPAEMIALVGHDIGHKIHVTPESRARYMSLLKADGVVNGFEALNYRKDGSQIWTSTNARMVTDANGEIQYTEGFMMDITGRKQAEAALKASEMRFRSLFENAPISLWEEDFSLIAAYLDELRRSGVTDFRAYFENHPEVVANCAGKVEVVAVNEMTLKLYHAKSKEAILEGIGSVFSEESFSVFREELIALAEGKTRFDCEAINQTLLGDKIHVALSLTLAPGSDATAHRVFISINDITKYKQVEQVIQQSNEELVRLTNELESRNRNITLFSEMDNLFQACQTSEEVYSIIAQYAPQLFAAESGSLLTFNASRSTLDVVATWGQSQTMKQEFSPDACWALRRGRMHIVNDTSFGMVCSHLPHPTLGASLCIPLVAQGDTPGVITLISALSLVADPDKSDLELAPFSEVKLQLAASFAEHIGLALVNLKLRETLRHQAIRDPLTNLYNRRYMEETLEREIKRAERKDAVLGIIMLDIDDFKEFNDILGHEAGDIILRELGNIFHTHIRKEDVACRYGGDEFILILPESTLIHTCQRAEELREGARHLNTQYDGKTSDAITLSLGVAIYPEHGATVEILLRAADRALYRAKAEGRNRVIVAG